MLLATAVAPFVAASEHLLLADDLSLRPVEVVALEDDLLTVRDAGGVRTLPLASVFALLAETPAGRTTAAPPRPAALLLLAGGQRLHGMPGVASEDEVAGDALRWRHPWLGELEVPIERVREVRLPAWTGDADTDAERTGGVDEASDRVELANGDALSGFVLGIAAEVEIEVAASGDRPRSVSVPIERVARVLVRSQAPPRSGRRAWFHERTVIDLDRFAIAEGGTVVLTTPLERTSTKPVAVELRDLAAVAFSRERWWPLGALEPAEVSGPPTRWRVPAPRELEPRAALGLGAIEAWGPLEVRWELPEAGMGFAAELELPEDARAWADLACVIESGGREVFRRRLDDANPRADLRVELPGRDLVLRIEDTGNGPIEDRVILRRARLARP